MNTAASRLGKAGFAFLWTTEVVELQSSEREEFSGTGLDVSSLELD